jgi:hypothetical protein
MFLHVVGYNQRFMVIEMTFRRFVENISHYFHEVFYAVGELHNKMIVPPSTYVHPKILNSPRWYPYFKVSVLTNQYQSLCRIYSCINMCMSSV